MKYDAELESAAIAAFQKDPTSKEGRAAGGLLCKMHAGIISIVVRRFVTGRVRYEDLKQEAAMALLRSVPGFDPEKAKLSTYAKRAIVNAMISYRRTENADLTAGDNTHQKAARLARAEEEGVAVDEVAPEGHFALREHALRGLTRQALRLDAPLADGSGSFGDRVRSRRASPEEMIDTANQREVIDSEIAKLPPRSRKIIERLYLADEPETMEEIGESMGVSKERIRQIKEEALALLRLRIARAPFRAGAAAIVAGDIPPNSSVIPTG